MEAKKSKRGGARPGAGRKPKPRDVVAAAEKALGASAEAMRHAKTAIADARAVLAGEPPLFIALTSTGSSKSL